MLGTPKWIYQKYPRNMIEHWIQDWNAIDFLLIIFTWHPNCKAFLIWSCQFAPASITLDAAFIWHPSNWFSISGTIVLISSTLEVFYNFAPEQLPFCLPAISFQGVFAAELRGCIAVGSTCDNGRLLEAKKAVKQFKVANLWQDMRNMMGWPLQNIPPTCNGHFTCSWLRRCLPVTNKCISYGFLMYATYDYIY